MPRKSITRAPAAFSDRPFRLYSASLPAPEATAAGLTGAFIWSTGEARDTIWPPWHRTHPRKMENEREFQTIGIIGGTGNLGTGLAARWALAGYRVVIGSRSEPKAQAAVHQLRERLPDASVTGASNRDAAQASDIVVVTVPFAHQQSTLEDIRPAVAGKIVVDTTVPLVPPKVARVQMPAEGSAAIRAQQILGDEVEVVSAFQNVAAELLATDHVPDCDVLVAGNKAASREKVIGLAEQAGFRAWHAGPLANAAAMEALTSVLIFMNKRYDGSHTGIQITGISEQ
jgi:NADPH-dependent F420 reductase